MHASEKGQQEHSYPWKETDKAGTYCKYFQHYDSTKTTGTFSTCVYTQAMERQIPMLKALAQ